MAEKADLPERSRRWVATARCLQVDQWTAEVIGALQSTRLRPILLKGPAVARWLYPDDPAARQYVDVDILVSPAEFDQARQVLGALGFARRSEELVDELQDHAEQWDREVDGAAVDLHRTLHGCESLPNESVWEEVSTSTQRLDIENVVAEIPGLPVLAMHVALHPPAHDAPGSQTWTDLQLAVAQVGSATWQQAAELARRLGVDGEMGAKLAMVNGSLAADLGLTGPPPLRLLLRREGAGALALGRLAALDTARTRIRYCFQKMFPPRSYLRQSLPVADKGPMGLLAARAVRATSCVLRLPIAIIGWRRARAEHRGNL